MPWENCPAGTLPALRGSTTGLVAGDVGSGAGSLTKQPCRGVLAPLPLPTDEPPLGHIVPAVTTMNYGLKPVSSGRRGAEEQHRLVPTPISSGGIGALGKEQPAAAGEAAVIQNHPIWGQNLFDSFGDDTRASHRHLATRGGPTPLATQDMI
jgi:hypothetical protein